VPDRLDHQRRAREHPHGIPRAVGADRQAREDDVFLGAVEGRVQPRTELGERACVARELPVDAVGRERYLQQDRAGDQPPALARGEADGGEDPDQHRDRGHLVGGEAAVSGPARDVARVRADEERREEAVDALDGRVEQDLVLVDLRRARDRVLRARAFPDHAAQRRGAQGHAGADEPDDQQRQDVRAQRCDALCGVREQVALRRSDLQDAQERGVRARDLVHIRLGARNAVPARA
jgi:hypothetical protein